VFAVSDCNKHFPLLAVRAFHQNRSCHRWKSRFSRCYDTGSSSLCGTDFIVDGKSGYFAVSLDLDATRVIFIKETNSRWEVLWFSSDHGNDKWHSARTIHPAC